MKHKKHIEFENRQHATLPQDVIRNDALFEGTLIKGGRPLTSVQRTGTFIIGLFYLSLPTLSVVVIVQTLMHKEPLLSDFATDGPLIAAVVITGAIFVMAGFAYIGVRMLRHAITAPKPH